MSIGEHIHEYLRRLQVAIRWRKWLRRHCPTQTDMDRDATRLLRLFRRLPKTWQAMHRNDVGEMER